MYFAIALLNGHVSQTRQSSASHSTVQSTHTIIPLLCHRIPVVVNKLSSPVTLSSIDYKHLPLCQSNAQQPIHPANAWDQAVTALHGDALYEEPALPLYFKRNIYCGQLCVLLPTQDGFGNSALLQQAIQDGYHYQFLIDQLPVAFRYENQDRIAMQYWGGIPLGMSQVDASDERFNEFVNNTQQQPSFLYNHYRIELLHDNEHILRTTIQPFSIRHNVTDYTKWPALPMGEPMPQACRDRSQHLPVYYGQLQEIPPQPLESQDPILFTYDVVWTAYTGKSSKPYVSRWSVFLQMDNGVPITVPLFSLLVAILVNGMLIGVLVTWVLRDLSYKPLTSLVELETQEQEREAQLWPLSTRVFFTPRYASLMVVCCGNGAQWLLAGLAYVILFRCGLVNESLGAGIVTPAVVLYMLAALPAGYVTGRMSIVFHQTQVLALAETLAVAAVLPILGMIVVHLVYDVLPDASTAPSYNAITNATPIILTWLFLGIPLTIGGGYLGYVHGPWTNFPVSSGSGGYQDLALQDEAQENQWESSADDWKSPFAKWLTKCWYSNGRLSVLFLLGGLPPLACGFVEYAYGVAGPIFMGYFSSSSFFAIASFVLFLTCVAAISVLLFYKHIRMQNYQWWWASFVTGASSGLYIFLLSLSWICLDASGREVMGKAMFGYVLWFLFASSCVGLMTGFVAVTSCALFSRMLYGFLSRRSDANTDSSSLLLGEQQRESTETLSSMQSPLEPLEEASELSSVDGRAADGVMRRARPQRTSGSRDSLRIRGLATPADV